MRVQPFSYLEQLDKAAPAPSIPFSLYLGASDFSTLDGTSANNGLVKFANDGTVDGTFSPSVTYNTIRYMEYVNGHIVYATNSSIEIVDALTGASISSHTVGTYSQIFGMKAHGNYVYFTGNNMGNYDGTYACGSFFRIDKDGNFDTTFRTNVNFTGTAYTQPVTYIDDDYLLVCGSWGGTTGYAYFRVLNTSDGTTNTTFHSGRTSDTNSAVSSITKVGSLIVITGNFSSYGGTSYGRIIGFNLDGTLNSTFNTNAGTGFPSSPNVVPRFNVTIDSSTFFVFFAGAGAASATYNGTSIPDRVCVINSDGSLNTTKTNYFGSGINSLPRYAPTDDNGYFWISGEGFTTLNGVSYNNLFQIDMSTGTINPTYSYTSGMQDSGGSPTSTFLVSLVSNNN